MLRRRAALIFIALLALGDAVALLDYKTQARQTLAQAAKTLAATRSAVAGLRADTRALLGNASGVLKRLAQASRQRAAAWQVIVQSLRTRNAASQTGAGANESLDGLRALQLQAWYPLDIVARKLPIHDFAGSSARFPCDQRLR